MGKRKEYSETLGVEVEASTKTIQAYYESLKEILQADPSGNCRSVSEQLNALNEAYVWLIENRPRRANLRPHQSVVLAADMVGYSRLMAVDPKGTISFYFRCRSIFEECALGANGRIFNTAGDAILCEFLDASSALKCAVEIQSSVRRLNNYRPSNQKIFFRIGINYGEVFAQDNDLMGDAVNLAARIQTVCKPGGICLSPSVFEALDENTKYSIALLGEMNFKNYAKPIRVYALSDFRESLEPSAVNEVTKITSFMLGDLEKTVLSPREMPSQTGSDNDVSLASGTKNYQQIKQKPLIPSKLQTALPKEKKRPAAWIFISLALVGALALLSPLAFHDRFSASAPTHDPQRKDVNSDCDAGIDAACEQLGNAYLIGKGVTQSDSAAARSFMKTCGDGPSEPETLCSKGVSIAQKSCAAGDTEACRGLAEALMTGRGVAVSLNQASSLLNRACNLGDAAACLSEAEKISGRGICHRCPLEEEAKSLFERACQYGEKMGCERAEAITRRNTGESN